MVPLHLTEKVIDFYFFNRILAAKKAQKSSTWINKVFKSALKELDSEIISFEICHAQENVCLKRRFSQKTALFCDIRKQVSNATKICKEFGSSVLVHSATKVAYIHQRILFSQPWVFTNFKTLYFRYRQGSFNNYVDQILTNFDPLPPSSGQAWTFYIPPPPVHVDKRAKKAPP